MITVLYLTLHNTPGTLTHFPPDHYHPSIPDLTLSSAHITSVIQGWLAEPLRSGDLDHALITILLNITPPTFTPRRVHKQTDWANFEEIIQEETFPS